MEAEKAEPVPSEEMETSGKMEAEKAEPVPSEEVAVAVAEPARRVTVGEACWTLLGTTEMKAVEAMGVDRHPWQTEAEAVATDAAEAAWPVFVAWEQRARSAGNVSGIVYTLWLVAFTTLVAIASFLRDDLTTTHWAVLGSVTFVIIMGSWVGGDRALTRRLDMLALECGVEEAVEPFRARLREIGDDVFALETFTIVDDTTDLRMLEGCCDPNVSFLVNYHDIGIVISLTSLYRKPL